jgi:hypothetical protein
MDIADMLKTLAGTNFENLFVLAGLAFVALAILGDISGKISPGRFGRIASGVLGAILVAFGIWMHTGSQLSVRALEISADKKVYVSHCPVEVGLSGIVEAAGSGTVIYQFEYSDGGGTRASSIEFDKADSKLVTAAWPVSKSMNNGWARLNTIAPTKMQSPQSDPVSVTCEEQTSQVSPPASVTTVLPAPAPAPVVQPPRPAALDLTTDSVQLASVSPGLGTPVKRGQPFPFEILVDYNLTSADSAIMSVSVAQLPASAVNCHGSGGELSDAVELPIVRGKHQVKMTLTWSGDTGAATKGRVYGRGFLTFVPMFWSNVNGRRGQRLNFFGLSSGYCYAFE